MKMMALVLIALGLSHAAALQPSYESWASSHNRTTSAHRERIFLDNVALIAAHNARADAGLTSYRMGLGQ